MSTSEGHGIAATVTGNRVSIVVATRNRAHRLPECLNGLKSLRLPEGVSCEVICVDNNSNDDTKAQVTFLGHGSPIPIVYVFESEPGLGMARNAGLRHAHGEIIAVTDDDCIADPHWLEQIWREFAAEPSLGLIGGRIELYDNQDLPVSIRTSRDRKTFELPSLFNFIMGCNMAIRRSALEQVGIFDPHLGSGSRLQSAEDVDLIYRMAQAGFGIVYCPDVLIFHHHGRRTAAERQRLIRSYLIGRGAFYAKHIVRGDGQILRMAFWEMRALLRNILGNAIRFKPTRDELGILLLLARGMLLYLWVAFGARIWGR